MSEQGTATEPITALDDARAGIDAVDDEIHALLMRRAGLVQAIGSAKRGGGGAYRPAREADILRRLYENNRDPLDFEIVYRLWREMIGGFTAMQAPLRVSVPHDPGLERLARDHFGAAAIITRHRDEGDLTAKMKADPSQLAIIRPDGWRVCLGGDAPNIVSALPVYGDGIDALCLANAEPQDSGGDLTVFAVSGGAPDDRLLCLNRADGDSLIALEGFRVGEVSAVRTVANNCGVEPGAVTCVGAFPAPIPRPA